MQRSKREKFYFCILAFLLIILGDRKEEYVKDFVKLLRRHLAHFWSKSLKYPQMSRTSRRSTDQKSKLPGKKGREQEKEDRKDVFNSLDSVSAGNWTTDNANGRTFSKKKVDVRELIDSTDVIVTNLSLKTKRESDRVHELKPALFSCSLTMVSTDFQYANDRSLYGFAVLKGGRQCYNTEGGKSEKSGNTGGRSQSDSGRSWSDDSGGGDQDQEGGACGGSSGGDGGGDRGGSSGGDGGGDRGDSNRHPDDKEEDPNSEEEDENQDDNNQGEPDENAVMDVDNLVAELNEPNYDNAFNPEQILNPNHPEPATADYQKQLAEGDDRVMRPDIETNAAENTPEAADPVRVSPRHEPPNNVGPVSSHEPLALRDLHVRPPNHAYNQDQGLQQIQPNPGTAVRASRHNIHNDTGNLLNQGDRGSCRNGSSPRLPATFFDQPIHPPRIRAQRSGLNQDQEWMLNENWRPNPPLPGSTQAEARGVIPRWCRICREDIQEDENAEIILGPNSQICQNPECSQEALLRTRNQRQQEHQHQFGLCQPVRCQCCHCLEEVMTRNPHHCPNCGKFICCPECASDHLCRQKPFAGQQ